MKDRTKGREWERERWKKERSDDKCMKERTNGRNKDRGEGVSQTNSQERDRKRERERERARQTKV